jgi:hypothetical protein
MTLDRFREALQKLSWFMLMSPSLCDKPNSKKQASLSLNLHAKKTGKQTFLHDWCRL